MMEQVTLCMPSNRPLAQARPSIDAALAYAAARGYRVLISDNSEDADKRAHYADLPAFARMIPSPGTSPLDNLMVTLDAAETPFILPMGDDDFVLEAKGAGRFDFSTLGEDCVGVRPTLDVFSDVEPLIKSLPYSVVSASASERLEEYRQKMGGANTLYYAFFRRQSLLDVIRSYHDNRRIVLGDFDWALITALLMEGRVLHDPSTLYRYDIGRWRYTAGIESTVAGFYASAGLSDGAVLFDAIFKFMDAYVVSFRSELAISEVERMKCIYSYTIPLLGGLVRRGAQETDRFKGFEPQIALLTAALADPNDDLSSVYHACARIADHFRPGLGDELIGWLEKSIAA
jgi:hypothetical protein